LLKWPKKRCGSFGITESFTQDGIEVFRPPGTKAVVEVLEVEVLLIDLPIHVVIARNAVDVFRCTPAEVADLPQPTECNANSASRPAKATSPLRMIP
jgi:hypothetical protein